MVLFLQRTIDAGSPKYSCGNKDVKSTGTNSEVKPQMAEEDIPF